MLNSRISRKEFFSALTCDRYKLGCTDCPSVVDRRESPKVAASYTLRKMVFRRRPDIVFCGISNWMSKMLRDSPLTQEHAIYTVNNPIPAPRAPQRHLCREELGIAPETKVILLAVHRASNKRKGFAQAAQALAKLAVANGNRRDISVAVLGSVDKNALADLDLPFKVVPLGFITDEAQKSMIYKAGGCLSGAVSTGIPVGDRLGFNSQWHAGGVLQDQRLAGFCASQGQWLHRPRI